MKCVDLILTLQISKRGLRKKEKDVHSFEDEQRIHGDGLAIQNKIMANLLKALMYQWENNDTEDSSWKMTVSLCN